MKYTGNDLIAMGFKPSKHFGLLLETANEFGDLYSEDAIIEMLLAKLPKELPRVEMRDEPLEWNRFITPSSDDERANLVGVETQMNELMRTPVVVAGAIMPDSCPAGIQKAMIPVGGIIKTVDAIIPSAHSADICCSMYATFYRSDTPIAQELDQLMLSTRFGAGGRYEEDWRKHDVNDEDVWKNPFLRGLEVFARKHMGDQGDGNHFAYIGETTFSTDDLNLLWEHGYDIAFLDADVKYRVLVTHHGSRGLGAQLYKRGQAAALKNVAEVGKDVPAAAAWIDMTSEEGVDYWDALQYIGRWTKANHETIHAEFLDRAGLTSVWTVHNQHNFVWQDDFDPRVFYHGKGATPAGAGVLGIIPLNMGAPILLVLGVGNEDALGFAPHGAGRNLSRTVLKARIGDDAAQAAEVDRSTNHIDVRWYSGKADVSETPCAYKDADSIIEQIEDFGLAKVLTKIMPLGCIMAGEGPEPAWKKKKNGN
jgi:tRNA-splicing ligase RtcB